MSQRTIFRMNFTLNHCPSNMSPAKWAKERAFYTWNGAYSAKDYMFASNKLLKDRTHNDYMAKSTGIFNLTHQLSSDEVEVYKQSIQNTSSHIWHPIISLNDEMSTYINDPNEAAHFLDYALSPLWQHSQLKKEKVNVVAGLHKDTDNRHMHISIWEKDNVKENTFWGNIPQRALDEVVVKSAYYFSEKKYQLHKARDKAIDALKEFCPSIREWQNQRYSDSVRHKLYKLAKELPSTGRLQYNSIFMKPFRKDIDTLVNYIVSSDHTLRSAYDDYLCAINGVSKELSDIMKESKVKTFKSANDTDMVKNIYANTYKELKQTKRAVSQYIATSGLIPDNLILQQQQGYINGNISSRSALKRFERGIHSQSLAAMFPFNSPLTLDDNGLVLGSNEFPVSLDIWKRGTDYQNSNAFIVGTPGGGKSFFCKLLLTQLYSDNTHILIIDPENEYEILCANLGGSYLDVGNASTGIFNPFHIYASLSDDGSISDSRETLSAHLRMLESFFKIILEGAGSETLETINNAVTMLYKKKKLVDVDSYDNIPADKFPIFDDLYNELLNQEKTTTSEILKVQFQRAIMYIQKFVGEGRYSKIWNGYSSINTKSDFIVFNFKTLFANKNTLVANAQMLLVLRYIEQQVINKRADIDVEHVAVIADEAHLFIDPKFPIALDFFYQMIKRIRKYKGSFIPITQAISDWTATPEVANKTTAILKEAQYSFVFKLKPNSAEDLARLFVAGGGLNDTELHSIIKAGTGDMFFIGNETLHTRFHVIANPYIRMLFEKRNVLENYFEEHFEYLNDLIKKGWKPGMEDPNDTSETEDTPEENGTEEIDPEEVEKENNDNIDTDMKINKAKLFFMNLVGKIKKVFKKK